MESIFGFLTESDAGLRSADSSSYRLCLILRWNLDGSVFRTSIVFGYRSQESNLLRVVAIEAFFISRRCLRLTDVSRPELSNAVAEAVWW